MDYLVIYLIIFGHSSGCESSYCKSYQKPLIQMCKDGTVSGTSVYIENRETPNEAVHCTCDVDLGGGTVNNVQYSGPGLSYCGIEFILGENTASFSCHSNTLSNPSPFSAIYFSKMVISSGYVCLSMTTDSNTVTITCHEPHVTTFKTPVSTTTSVSDTTSTTINTSTTTSTITTTSTTTSTSMNRVGPVLSTGDTNQNNTCPCNQESKDRTVLNQCADGASIAVVVGIIVGEAVLILLVHAVLWFLCCKRKDACSCFRKSLYRDEMKDNEAYGIVDISNISQRSKVILDIDYVNTELTNRQNPDT